VFALGLLVNSGDLLDLRYVITTSINAPLSAKCVAKHLSIAGRSDIKVGAGDPLPPYSQRGGVCATPGLVQFTLQPVCENVTLPFYSNGVEEMVNMVSCLVQLGSCISKRLFSHLCDIFRPKVDEVGPQ
jgi:hypothetical protein